MRSARVIAAFPARRNCRKNKAYLKFVDDIYQSDAYHSLSIEGYRVTPELIERVRAGTWNPDQNEADQKNRDALAARGYWQAFQKVKETVAQIIAGADRGQARSQRHREWYREMFQPCVAAGLIDALALAGYRNHFIYMQGSRHVPPRWEIVPDAMDAFFDLLEGEKEPAARIVLGHWLFGFIHPYPTGRAHGAVSHERHACVRRVSVDGDPGRRSRRLYEGARKRERPDEYRAVRQVYRRARETVNGAGGQGDREEMNAAGRPVNDVSIS